MKKTVSVLLLLAIAVSSLIGCTGSNTADSSEPPYTLNSPVSSAQSPDSTTQENQFVINLTSRKFHIPDCTYAKKISSENRDTSSLSAAELIDGGYIACGHCIGTVEESQTSTAIQDSSSNQSPDSEITGNIPADSTASAPDTSAPEGELHILNTGTKKIHKPDCRYAENKNREEYRGDIDDLLDDGYTLCKTCHKN